MAYRDGRLETVKGFHDLLILDDDDDDDFLYQVPLLLNPWNILTLSSRFYVLAHNLRFELLTLDKVYFTSISPELKGTEFIVYF